MRARSAYISSLSTTTILVVAALLMLGVLGAIVGFKHWPHGNGGPRVDPIGVDLPVVRVAPAASVQPVAKHVAAAVSPRASAPVVVATRAAAPVVSQRAAGPVPVVSTVEVVSSPPAAVRVAPTPVAKPGAHSQPASGSGPVPAPVGPSLQPVVGPVTSTLGAVGGHANAPVQPPALPG